jgi:hypothetical protein
MIDPEHLVGTLCLRTLINTAFVIKYVDCSTSKNDCGLKPRGCLANSINRALLDDGLILNSYFQPLSPVVSSYPLSIMLASKMFLVCLQAIIVTAQTPPGFTPAVTEPLQVTYGVNSLSPAGKKVARPGTIHIS